MFVKNFKETLSKSNIELYIRMLRHDLGEKKFIEFLDKNIKDADSFSEIITFLSGIQIESFLKELKGALGAKGFTEFLNSKIKDSGDFSIIFIYENNQNLPITLKESFIKGLKENLPQKVPDKYA